MGSFEDGERLWTERLGNLRNTVLAREYRLALPDARRLAAEMETTRRRLQEER